VNYINKKYGTCILSLTLLPIAVHSAQPEPDFREALKAMLPTKDQYFQSIDQWKKELTATGAVTLKGYPTLPSAIVLVPEEFDGIAYILNCVLKHNDYVLEEENRLINTLSGAEQKTLRQLQQNTSQTTLIRILLPLALEARKSLITAINELNIYHQRVPKYRKKDVSRAQKYALTVKDACETLEKAVAKIATYKIISEMYKSFYGTYHPDLQPKLIRSKPGSKR
jgi:hypothetical protein